MTAKASASTPEAPAPPRILHCGDCREPFAGPTPSRDCAAHMREHHGSAEAPGIGPPSNRPAKGESV